MGLSSADDPQVLKWATAAGRAVLTYDLRTMPIHAAALYEAGDCAPAVFLLRRRMSVREVANEVALIAECSDYAEWEGQVRFLPL